MPTTLESYDYLALTQNVLLALADVALNQHQVPLGLSLSMRNRNAERE